jgi:hypothetical protein
MNTSSQIPLTALLPLRRTPVSESAKADPIPVSSTAGKWVRLRRPRAGRKIALLAAIFVLAAAAMTQAITTTVNSTADPAGFNIITTARRDHHTARRGQRPFVIAAAPTPSPSLPVSPDRRSFCRNKIRPVGARHSFPIQRDSRL